MSDAWFSQPDSRVRFGWGAAGAHGIPATYTVVVDVLCFSTTVTVAADAGSMVWPYVIPAIGAGELAARKDAVVTVRRSAARSGRRLSLSPITWRRNPPPARVVLPSGNGSGISYGLHRVGRQVIVGCLRNRTAAAHWVAARLEHDADVTVTVLAAGERWLRGPVPGRAGGLRPSLEDLLGAGAIISAIVRSTQHPEWCSPEALAAAASFEAIDDLDDTLRRTGSAVELIDRGYPSDVWIASEFDQSLSVPVLDHGAFVNQA